jgi:ubiquinone/menaquinone biosynthesis C-methylase UbiE
MSKRIFTTANEEAIEAWNTVLFDKFCRFRYVVTRGLSRHGDVALERLAPAKGARLLDLGCGFGDTTVELGRRVGDDGVVVGVDAAGRFLECAAHEAAAAGLQQVSFRRADIQEDALGHGYDGAFSRFGALFFQDPIRALRNVRRALHAGGKLCLVVWRRREDNAIVHLAERALREIAPELPQNDEVTCGPGPFSMASADLVSDTLLASGFDRISLERFDAPLCIGRDLDEAVDFALSLGPAGERLRLAGSEAEKYRPALERALRATFQNHLEPDGVWLPSSTWIVCARAA